MYRIKMGGKIGVDQTQRRTYTNELMMLIRVANTLSNENIE